MVKRFAGRWRTIAAATLIGAAALGAAWRLWPAGPWLAAAIAACIALAGFAVLGLVRLHGAVRELLRDTAELKQSVRDIEEQQRPRLALAERRLAALAVKLEASEELEEPPG